MLESLTVVLIRTILVRVRTNRDSFNMTHLTLIRQLSKAYQAFEKYSASHVRDLGITPTQFDILATLGNQPPMTCKKLGDKTLITKGTLTGVLERLDAKGLIHRLPNEEDARSYKIGLSQSGKTLFEKVFPGHVEYLKQAFNATTSRDVSEWTKVLKSIELIFK